MASAGRILIMPKGDYDANSTYENLDLVKYKGTSWLAKKESKGIEPSEANSEYWQDVFEPNIANNLTTTTEGYALDARQGKVLDEKITKINNAFAVTDVTAPVAMEGVTITRGHYKKYGNIFFFDMLFSSVSSSSQLFSGFPVSYGVIDLACTKVEDGLSYPVYIENGNGNMFRRLELADGTYSLQGTYLIK